MDFSEVKLLCVGDLMLDRFLYGEVERISPEAPVPVLHLTRAQEMLGGAGNVVNNVIALGGQAVLVGLLGRDDAGDRLQRLMVGRNIESACVRSEGRPTICKTRFIASNQQVVRADEESRAPLSAAEREALTAAWRAKLANARAVVLADYGKGVLDAQMVGDLLGAARAAGVPSFVDPKTKDFTRYRGATCITPNLHELAAASGMAVDTEEAVVAAARHVMLASEAKAILVTRSEKGMMLVETSGAVHTLGARAREVFDVSGAGDTVIATLALCYASGQTLAQSIRVANAAAGVVVSKLGTATASLDEVIGELSTEAPGRPMERPPQLHAQTEAERLVADWKAQGLVVGFTNGCFDLLHPGHISLLQQARAACDRLVVALNTDLSISRLKGPQRPINDLESRARVLAAIRFVDCITSFEEETPLALIRTLKPDVLVKGADYPLEAVVGAELVRAGGGEVILADLTAGKSTTRIISRIRDAEAAVA